jgi:hypothetical protein
MACGSDFADFEVSGSYQKIRSAMSTRLRLFTGFMLIALAFLMLAAMILNLPSLWFVIDVLVIGVCSVAGAAMLRKEGSSSN